MPRGDGPPYCHFPQLVIEGKLPITNLNGDKGRDPNLIECQKLGRASELSSRGWGLH